MTLALFALGCTALPFVPPDVCGKAALSISGLGAFLALVELCGRQANQSRAPQIVGLVANGFVLLFALQAASGMHVIDRFEGSGLLGLICLAPFAALLLFLGTFIWRIWQTFSPPPDLPPPQDLPPAEDLPSAEPIDWLQCGTRIKAGQSKCPQCGWSYAEAQGPVEHGFASGPMRMRNPGTDQGTSLHADKRRGGGGDGGAASGAEHRSTETSSAGAWRGCPCR